jgi:hypothetical protein
MEIEDRTVASAHSAPPTVMCVAAPLGAQQPRREKPPISSHSAPVLTIDGLQFRDLDWRLSSQVRASDLLPRLSLEEKSRAKTNYNPSK